MASYIDADKLLMAIIKRHTVRYFTPTKEDLQLIDIFETIKTQPTADVVEVVRCKDCKHYKPYTKPVEDFDGECIVRGCETDENEFCSYGERK